MKDNTSKVDIAKRANYGIDAPIVIRNLSFIGIVLMIFTIISFLLHGLIWVILGTLFALGSIVCLAEALFMVWSSKKGKAKIVGAMIKNLHLKETDIVLDVGCGRGFVLNSIAKQLSSGKVIGIDIWNTKDQSGNHPQAALKNAETEGVLDRVEIINADARQLPFDENTFDVIVSSLAIHNIAVREGRKKAIDEIFRVLKTGGRVALLDFQYIEEYAQLLVEAGFMDITISKRYYSMFPPVRIVTGVKR